MFIELTIAALDGRRECPPSHDDEAARLPHCARLLVVEKAGELVPAPLQKPNNTIRVTLPQVNQKATLT
jgi:hypothetical protein